MSSTDPKSRPSFKRRQQLKKSISKHMPISNLCQIERYYEAAAKLYVKFESHYKKKDLDLAYIYGMRFVTFSLKALPQHNYHKSIKPELKALRLENEQEVSQALDDLEQLMEWMDWDELEKAELRRREKEALKRIQEQEAQMRKEEEERLAARLLEEKLLELDSLFPKTPSGVGQHQIKAQLPPQPLPQMSQQVQQPQQQPQYLDETTPLPPPIPYDEVANMKLVSPPPPYSTTIVPPSAPPTLETEFSVSHGQGEEGPLPPSYEDLLKRQQKLQQSSKSLSTGASSQSLLDDVEDDAKSLYNPLAPPVTTQLKPKKQEDIVPLATIRTLCTNDYKSLLKSKRVQVFFLTTYQGRMRGTPGHDSTNGCTVISPLVAINHLHSEGSGIPDMTVEEIIDDTAPKILARVRRKLGLAGTALIIPSDVHDFLVDEKILKQSDFAGVCGGNIMDSEHITDFLNLLENGSEEKGEEKKGETKKVSAALFFHEHVVSILKVVLADGTSWYDLVDSMPQHDKKGDLAATRTRCKDRASLESVLSWYACEKFSSTDAKYIDKNYWDDTMCDFDPRVFQAFVWKE